MKKHRKGFTLVELCLAMIVTGLVASALAAFMLSMGKCWGQVASAQSTAIAANQLSQRLFNRVQDVKRIGYTRDGSGMESAGFIYWRGDLDESGAIEQSEIAVMAYDSATKSLVVYQSDVTDEWTTDDLADPGSIDRLTNGVTPTPIVRNVNGATLRIDQPADASLAPTVSWRIKLLQSNGEELTETVSATLRARGFIMMPSHNNNFCKPRGVALVMVLMVVGIATIFGAAILTSSSLQAQLKHTTAAATEAQYLAESGINLGMYYLQNPAIAPVLSNNVYAGQTGISLGSSVDGTVDLTIEDQGSFTYDVTSQATVGLSSSNPITRSLKSRVKVSALYVVKDAALFAGNFTVPDNMTINGDVRSDGVVTKSLGATISGTIVATGSNASPWVARGAYPDHYVPTKTEINTYVVMKNLQPYYLYHDANGLEKKGKPALVGPVVTGTLTKLANNPSGVFYSTGDVTLGDCTIPGTLILIGTNANLTVTGNALIEGGHGEASLIVPGDVMFQSDANPKSLVVKGLAWLGQDIKATSTPATNCTIQIDGALMMASTTASISGNVQGAINVTYVSPNVQVPYFSDINRVPVSVQILHWGM